ncbi:hypothetical protein IGI04_034655 [Brassica rapa subsp. trilocularis]|uniref:Uncharacterized protein n=1 Tax=Brassica rapa subsp. trilocularis TaxID=1813537 RepID=A0ABQ7LC76_BRACM|nr:hypothetical protein IGI04_034655 [Brassica rapa subsp. trilocularis]
MAPKTRFAGKTNKEGAPEKKKKNESAAEKKKAVAEKKKAAAVKRRREAKKTETAEKKRKQDSSSSESSSNPTKRRRTASSPEQHSDPDHSPAPSAELLSQDDREGTPSPSFPIEPQKAPTQTPSEAENPLQAPITSNNREDPNRESHSPEAAINNEAQRTIGSNNSDSNPPEAAIGSATIDNDAPRTPCLGCILHSLSLLGVGVPHGVLGDIWMHLELKGREIGDHWTSRAWERGSAAIATCPERRPEVARISHPSQSDLPKRHPEVARVSMARRHEAKPGATSQSDPLRSLPKAGATCRSDMPRSLRGLLVISLCTFYISKTYVLNIFCSHQADYLLIYLRNTQKLSGEVHLLDFDCCVLVDFLSISLHDYSEIQYGFKRNHGDYNHNASSELATQLLILRHFSPERCSMKCPRQLS